MQKYKLKIRIKMWLLGWMMSKTIGGTPLVTKWWRLTDLIIKL